MSIEKEVIGEINKAIFTKKRAEFTDKFGKPVFRKRLGLMILDRNNPSIDTRVRVTNGKAEIMQKVVKAHDGKGNYQKLELPIKIPNSALAVLNAYTTYKNLLVEKYNNQLVLLLVQTKNYIWKTREYELKLSYQFGKNDYFTFEIESLSASCDVKKVQADLGLVPTENHASMERKVFRATQIDLDASVMTDEQVLTVIKHYIKR